MATARIAEAVFRGNVASGDDGDDLSPLSKGIFPLLSGGHGDGAGRLAGELRALVEEAERVLDLVLLDEHELRPRARGRSLSACSPANGAARPSAIERGRSTGTGSSCARPSVQRVRALGLDADHAHVRERRRDARRSARRRRSGRRSCRRRARPPRSRARRVPWPAITSGSSNGWTSVRPVSRDQLRRAGRTPRRPFGLEVDLRRRSRASRRSSPGLRLAT